MQKQFQLAIVGVGAITMNAHMRAVLGLPSVEIAALVDRSPARVESAGAFFGREFRYFPSVEAIDIPIDGAIVATPNHTHYAVSKALLERGIPVLVEKPLTENLAEADELLALSEAKGALIAAGYSTRFRDSVELAARLVAGEHFGKVESFSYISGSKGGWSPVDGYVVPGKRVGGVLTVHGAHFIDRMLNWFGYPAAFEYFDDGEAGPEANCVAKFLFNTADGRTIAGRMQFSKTAQLADELVVRTGQGLLILPDGDFIVRFRPHGSSIVYTLDDSGPKPERVGRNTFEREIEDFVNAVRGNTAPRVDGKAARESVRLLTDLYSVRQPLPHPWSSVVAAGEAA